jgi:hypothetical protein
MIPREGAYLCVVASEKSGGSFQLPFGKREQDAPATTEEPDTGDNTEMRPRRKGRGREAGGRDQRVAGSAVVSAAIFSRRWVMRCLDSELRTAMPYAAGSPTMKTFFLPRVIAV